MDCTCTQCLAGDKKYTCSPVYSFQKTDNLFTKFPLNFRYFFDISNYARLKVIAPKHCLITPIGCLAGRYYTSGRY